MRTKKKSTFLPWVYLATASCLFSGFAWSWITDKRGKGGGMAGRLIAFAITLTAWYYVWPSWAMMLMLVLTASASIITVAPAEELAAKIWGPMPRHTGEQVTRDYNFTNIDEVVGGLIATYGAWNDWMSQNEKLAYIIVASVIFTAWDTAKWWPVNEIEESSKHLYPIDVTLDDVAGGMLSGLVVISAYIFAQLGATILLVDHKAFTPLF